MSQGPAESSIDYTLRRLIFLWKRKNVNETKKQDSQEVETPVELSSETEQVTESKQIEWTPPFPSAEVSLPQNQLFRVCLAV